MQIAYRKLQLYLTSHKFKYYCYHPNQNICATINVIQPLRLLEIILDGAQSSY
jgi:hypothetical protein